MSSSRAPSWLPVVVLVPLLVGCQVGRGCSDVKITDTVQVNLDGQTVGDAHVLVVRLCQDGACSEVEVPANQYTITLSTAELRPSPDLDEPGRISATVTNGEGDVVGATTTQFSFREVADACGSSRRQEVSIEAGTP